MVITAWKLRNLMHRLSVEHSVRNALEAATALDEQNVDVAHMALRIAEHAADLRHKATLLSSVARILTEAGRTEEGLEILLGALDTSKLAGRDTVMEVLADGATTLASVDNGELLRNLCEELERVDDWFGA